MASFSKISAAVLDSLRVGPDCAVCRFEPEDELTSLHGKRHPLELLRPMKRRKAAVKGPAV
jgi:hypothetical protein